MVWFPRVLLGVTFAALALTTAQANPLPKDGLTLQELDQWLTASGYKTTVEPNNSAVVFIVGDQKLVAYLNECSNNRCQSIQFYYGIHFDKGVAPDDSAAAVIMNTWNRDHRWTRAYADKGRDANLEMDLSVVSGVDTDGLETSLKLFIYSQQEFRKFVQ